MMGARLGFAIVAILAVGLAFLPGSSWADGPVVSNVRVSERADEPGVVDIYYDLGHPSGWACEVRVFLSKDGGATFPFGAWSVSGDVGPAISVGTGKHIVWVAKDDYPGEKISRAAVRVLADDHGGVTPGEMAFVPAGTFDMGDPWNEGYTYERPVHAVTLSPYYIGKYEVTNQEICDVYNWAHGLGKIDTVTTSTVTHNGQELLDLNSSYCQISYTGGAFEPETRQGYPMAAHPVVEVSWYGAVAYCQWLSEREGRPTCYDLDTWELIAPQSGGYRLPTEAEWERAAGWDPAGSGRHWRYGFTGDNIDCSRANYHYCNPLGLTSYPYTSPVGYYDGANAGTVNSASAAGCYDMSGNVWEWCHDWSYRVYTGDPVTDPQGPSTGSYRVLRGGCWNYSAYNCRSALRGWLPPRYSFHYFGFRVCRSVPRH